MVRAVVTGIGAVTPLANTFSSSWQALLEGRTGIAGLTRVRHPDLPWQIAGEVRHFNPEMFLSLRETRRLDLFAQYAVAAAVMAAEDAGLLCSSGIEERRHRSATIPGAGGDLAGYVRAGAVFIGSSRGGISTVEQALSDWLSSRQEKRRSRMPPSLMPATTIGMAPSSAALRLGMRGSCLGISNACASGTNALGEAFRLIRSGYHGPVIAGGAEAPLCTVCLAGYGSAGALSRAAVPSGSRPFDRTRDGFVLAEGACCLVVENLEVALRRGAPVHGEIIGYGNTVDARHQTVPDASGEAAAIRTALDDAGVSPDDIDFISAHGTSTPLGDRVEAEAIGTVFGDRSSRIPVSALKASTGHMLAASGAFEAASTIMSLREGIIPPTINLVQRDSACRLNILPLMARQELSTAVSSSFGFGGVNAVLVLKRF